MPLDNKTRYTFKLDAPHPVCQKLHKKTLTIVFKYAWPDVSDLYLHVEGSWSLIALYSDAHLTTLPILSLDIDTLVAIKRACLAYLSEQQLSPQWQNVIPLYTYPVRFGAIHPDITQPKASIIPFKPQDTSIKTS
tara:strand:- start:320 stop:724 length:405 start_codon:yes stop_codon:yes gene_type:complete